MVSLLSAIEKNMEFFSVKRKFNLPVYEFQCNDCNHQEDRLMSYSELSNAPFDCDNCGGKKCLCKRFSVPSIIVDGFVPKTIGDLADKNTERMVKEGKLNRNHLNYHTNRIEKKNTKERQERIAKMSEKQKEKYIMEGK